VNSRCGCVDAVTPSPPAMSSLDPVFDIEHLTPADVPANVALSRSVGWKDVESEWRVLHDAGDVRGVRHEGRVVAQGVLGDYDNATTLAKMVVAGDWQRRGLGARLLDGFLAQADARGVPVGLCATDLGRPLYESRQFEVSGELVILTGTAGLGTTGADAVVPLLDAETAVELDRRFSGCERGRMVRARFREAGASHRVALASGGQGFGLASAQGEGTLVGPILADTDDGARALAAALLSAAVGPVRIDVPVEHVAFRQWLQAIGLREQGVRVEMARGAGRMPWQVAERFALATQAWG
jgi:GNAT superfamily N-acetyltransferase